MPFATLAVLLAVAPGQARAESFHTCAGFIDSVPAVITSPGVWCLRQDLSTAITASAAITVQTNNVTIDCNGFKLGGLAAGPNPTAYGIHAVGRRNLSVRNCNIRGFSVGIAVNDFTSNSGGHVVEDNMLESNAWIGIWVNGLDIVVRCNLVRDTGGSIFDTYSAAIATEGTADILDNIITGVAAAQPYFDSMAGHAFGIHSALNGLGSISGNRIRDITGCSVDSGNVLGQ